MAEKDEGDIILKEVTPGQILELKKEIFGQLKEELTSSGEILSEKAERLIIYLTKLSYPFFATAKELKLGKKEEFSKSLRFYSETTYNEDGRIEEITLTDFSTKWGITVSLKEEGTEVFLRRVPSIKIKLEQTDSSVFLFRLDIFKNLIKKIVPPIIFQ